LAESATVSETATVDHVTRGELAFGCARRAGHGCRDDEGQRSDTKGEATPQCGGTHGEVDLSFARLCSVYLWNELVVRTQRDMLLNRATVRHAAERRVVE
jgi:hypothetical protein